MTQTDWNTVNWRQTMKAVRRLRQRIYQATQENDTKKVRSLQKLMLRSRANILMSVRRVTQTNKGKNTPGVDHLTVKTPTERGRMADRLLAGTPWKAKPAKRVYIPKSNGKKRPLGIPVMEDRARQAIVKNALEPHWEARFEGTSYGFRPGRGCHDAIQKIWGVARPNYSKKWVVDADIKGAFDNISHNHLMDTIGSVPAKELIKQWLKAGYVEDGSWHSTDAGTPQGGVISPLLANIALHGMEEALGIRYGISKKDPLNPWVIPHTPRLAVRYADDFVVFCETKEDAEQVIPELTAWLDKRGLKLSEEKTRIVHLTEGFDFLGFTVRHYEVKATNTGYKILIRPSRDAVKRIKEKLRQEWMALQGQPVNKIIKTLNPIIRGWANYHRRQVASVTFKRLDQWMFTRQCRWAKFTHPHRNKKWLKSRYWGKLNLSREDKWVFGNTQTGAYLQKFAWFPIERHIPVSGRYSPDNPNLREYWEKRKEKHTVDLRLSDRKIANRQKGLCPHCGDSLFNGETTGLFAETGEQIQRHHLKPRAKGGDNTYRNQRFLHLYCHQQLHSQDRIAERANAHETMVAEEQSRLRTMLALEDEFEWPNLQGIVTA